MEKKELHSFVNFMVRNKNLTHSQRVWIERQVEKDISRVEQNPSVANSEEKRGQNSFTPLSPYSTFKFLSDLNNPLGLKYLVHDFDYGKDDERPTSWNDFVSQVIKKWDQQQIYNVLPKSLWFLFKNFIFGTSPWFDMNGVVHNSYIENPKWIDWCSKNNLHPIYNEEFYKEIQSFANSISIRNTLGEFISQISRETELSISTVNLSSADFYTNTRVVFSEIRRILEQTIKPYSENYPEISINFSRESIDEVNKFEVITIIQKGSFANKSLTTVMRRLKKSNDMGVFGSIRNALNGYCLWSVESIWDGEPKRWNILREPQSDIPEIEDLTPESIPGFVHILKFYQS